jgi:hypothetical protein
MQHGPGQISKIYELRICHVASVAFVTNQKVVKYK